MASRQIMFFATADDLSSVLSSSESVEHLQYIRTGMSNIDIPQVYDTYSKIPEFGKAVHPTAVANSCYLIVTSGTEITVRPVPQTKGGVLFAVDQLKNPDSIALRPGGRYGSDVILCGMLGTVSQSAASKSLYALAGNLLRKSFSRHEEFLVGPEAMQLWNAGVRLTIGTSSPPEFDLRHTG